MTKGHIIKKWTMQRYLVSQYHSFFSLSQPFYSFTYISLCLILGRDKYNHDKTILILQKLRIEVFTKSK